MRKGSWWPKDKSNRIALILVGALMAFVMFAGAIVVLATVDLFPPKYSAAEQNYLDSVHRLASGPWPSDDRLIWEGHQVCAALERTNGDYDTVSDDASFLSRYRFEQRADIVGAATAYFCNDYWWAH